jgi:hypothetical protein
MDKYKNKTLNEIRELHDKWNRRINTLFSLTISGCSLLVLNLYLPKIIVTIDELSKIATLFSEISKITTIFLSAGEVGLLTIFTVALLRKAEIKEIIEQKKKEEEQQHNLEIKQIIEEDNNPKTEKNLIPPYEHCVIMQQAQGRTHINLPIMQYTSRSNQDESNIPVFMEEEQQNDQPQTTRNNLGRVLKYRGRIRDDN